MEVSPKVEDEKLERWKEATERLEHIDVGNSPLDENIRETLVALNVIDIPTTASCGGHLERSDDGPFLFVQNIEIPPADLDESVQKKWKEGQDKLLDKVRELLGEFNSKRLENKYRLYLQDVGQPGYRIQSGAEKEWDALQAKGQPIPDEQSTIKELIRGAQEEFAAFTAFAKEKYFGSQ